MKHRIAAAALLFATVGIARPAAPTHINGQADLPLHPTAVRIPLDVLPAGGYRNAAFGVNEVGTIVGQADTTNNIGNTQVARWSIDGDGELLGQPLFGFDREDGWGRAVNESGQIVGTSDLGYVTPRPASAWRMEPDGTVLELSNHGSGEDINDAGVTVGYEWTPEGWRAARWNAAGQRTFLGDAGTIALAINNAGWIAGARLSNPAVDWQPSTAVLWAPDGTLVELPSSGEAAWATDINDFGVAAGTIGGRAAIWSTDRLITMSPDQAYLAFLNDVGDVVYRSGGDIVAWRPAMDARARLPRGELASAAPFDVNNEGVVVGVGVELGSDPDGPRDDSRAVAWRLGGPPVQQVGGPTSSTSTTAIPTSTTAPAAPAVPVAAPPRYTG
jgi:hypothetical protein